MKKLIIVVLLFILAPGLQAQEEQTDKRKGTQALVDSQRYVFVAQTALPMRGRTRQLTSIYTMSVSKDSLAVDLPYFGRAFSAPLYPSEGPLRFTSTDFSYTLKQRKKGGWDVQIKPNDAKSVRQINMTISSTGYASMQVSSNNRDPISFNGYIASGSPLR